MNKSFRLYTTCTFCGGKMNPHDKRMSCVACPKRPVPIDTYSDGMNRVQVFEPSTSSGVQFSDGSDWMPDTFKGVSL